jgi:hypothetical protein
MDWEPNLKLVILAGIGKLLKGNIWWNVASSLKITCGRSVILHVVEHTVIEFDTLSFIICA